MLAHQAQGEPSSQPEKTSCDAPAVVLHDDASCKIDPYGDLQTPTGTTSQASPPLEKQTMDVTNRCLPQDRSTFIAMAVMAASAFLYSAQYATVKLGKDHSGFWAMAFMRGVVGSIASLVTAVLSKKRQGPIYGAHKSNIKWLVLRGVFGAITIISAFLAVTEIDLSSASVIMATSTLWTAAIAVFVEKGSWNTGDSLATLLCLVGVVFVARPSSLFEPSSSSTRGSGNATIGIGFAVLSAFAQAGVNLTIRRIKDEETSVITLYSMVACTVVALPGMVYEQVASGPTKSLGRLTIWGWVNITSTGLLSYSAQMLKTFALQISKGVGVLVLRYLDSLFGFMWDNLLFDAVSDDANIIGVLLIITGCLISLFGKSFHKGNGLLPRFHKGEAPTPNSTMTTPSSTTSTTSIPSPSATSTTTTVALT